MKKVLVVLLCLMMVVPMVAFAAADEAEPEDGDLIKTAMLTFALSTEQWQLMSQGVVDNAADFGMEVTVIDCGDNPSKQVEQFESCIEAGYELLIVSPADHDSLEAVGKQAREAGIPVVSLDDPGFSCESYVLADEFNNAYGCSKLAAEWILENWPEKTELNVCLLNYEYSPVCVIRAEGLMAGLTETLGDGVTTNVVADISPVDAAEANTMCESVLQAYPVDVCLAIAGDQLYGFGLAAENAGVDPASVVGAAMDVTPMSSKALSEGKYIKFLGSWGSPQYDKARVMLEAAQKAYELGTEYEGEPVQVTYDITYVDQSNVDQLREDFGWAD